jgi:hypothetical protein
MDSKLILPVQNFNIQEAVHERYLLCDSNQ